MDRSELEQTIDAYLTAHGTSGAQDLIEVVAEVLKRQNFEAGAGTRLEHHYQEVCAGTGKSTLLSVLIEQEILNGRTYDELPPGEKMRYLRIRSALGEEHSFRKTKPRRRIETTKPELARHESISPFQHSDFFICPRCGHGDKPSQSWDGPECTSESVTDGWSETESESETDGRTKTSGESRSVSSGRSWSITESESETEGENGS